MWQIYRKGLKEKNMEELDYWRLCEELSVFQAALLVVGQDPSCTKNKEGERVYNLPKGYEAAKTAICGGLRNFVQYESEYLEYEQYSNHPEPSHFYTPDLREENNKHFSELLRRSIIGKLVEEQEYDLNGHFMGFCEDTVDVHKSTVNVASLKQWLRLKGFTAGFFFPELVETMDFLDPFNPRYAPKLAAAVKAWQAVTDAGKKSPKQALDKWLRENAVQFGLTNEDGKPIENAIEECSKVANWNAKGGATKTPT